MYIGNKLKGMAVTTRFCKQTLRRRPPHNKTINDNNWARMVDRNNSVSIEDDEEEEKKHYDKKKRRRGNQINPDSVKIADITRSIPRTHTPDAKKAAPKRDIFQFHCEGDIAGEDDVSSKHVEWKATFDKPIEQLIYPSLQRVNNEGYEERRRAYISLHGSHSSSMVSQQANQSSGSAFGDNIKIDLLPDTEQSVDNKIMFLHTPKWTINISPSRNIPGSRMGAFSPSRSLLESVDTEGEKFLRQKIKEKHHEHLEQQRKERKELELLSSPFHSLSYEKRKAKFGQNISMSQDSGEYVYNNLVSRTLKSRDGKNKIEKLTELTPTEVAYQEHSKVVRETVPSEHQHTQSGLLYFRVRNQLNTARLQEIEAMNHRNMTYSHRKMMRKSSNTFSLRVSALRDSPRNSTVGLHEGENKKLATLTQKIDEMHATRNEDRVMVTAQDLHDLPDLQELNLGRLNRAVNNKLAGFDLLILPPKSAAGKPNAEKSLLSSVEGAYHSPAVRKDAAFRAEINKREAQDRLLLHQLDAGLLPETFIKSQSDAEALTVNLSKYGIGDDRGLCLGKW